MTKVKINTRATCFLVMNELDLALDNKSHLNSCFLMQISCKCLLLLVPMITLFSCQKDHTESFPSDQNEFISFNFEEGLNEGKIAEDVEGQIFAKEIVLSVPEVVKTSKLIASFEYEGAGVYVNGEKQESGVTENDFSQPITYEVHAADETVKTYKIKVSLLPDVKSEVPHIYIQTDEEAPVDSKEEYVQADIQINGKGAYEDFEGRTKIRGRGHDSWNMPKKPYKLKLEDKSELLGLLPGKKWILIANYRAESLMLDAVGFRMAGLLDMPYTQHAVPVDVTLNGEYIGSYTFTEQKEAKKNRINVGDEGLYLNMDTYMHKPPGQFYSEFYELPVMIRYPKLDDLGFSELETKLEEIKNDFELLEEKVAAPDFPENDYLDYIDAEELVNYLIVYNLSLNQEINHPKSTFIHKHKNGKYKMGPVWDFDWAFGYDSNLNKHFVKIDNELLINSMSSPGTNFFSRLLEDPEVQMLYKERWGWFKANKFPLLLEYIEDYAEAIEGSYLLDYDKWGEGVGDAETAANQLIDWLYQRSAYMDEYVSGF